MNNNKAPLLYYFKICAPYSPETLNSGHDFSRVASFLSLAMKISRWYDDEIVKKVWRTHRQTDGRTEPFIELLDRC